MIQWLDRLLYFSVGIVVGVQFSVMLSKRALARMIREDILKINKN